MPSASPQKSPRLTIEQCQKYLEDYVFTLSTPKIQDYSQRSWPGTMGLEVEMLAVKERAGGLPDPISFEADHVKSIFLELAKQQVWEALFEQVDGKEVLLRIKTGKQENISFEPGGQVEFSSQPYLCLASAGKRLREIQDLVQSALQAHGMSLIQVGMNPWHKLDAIGIQTPKQRYIAMNQYFSGIHSAMGPRMMRQSCSIQVCLDFGTDERMLARRYLAAQLLAPFTAAAFAYSPYVDCKLAEGSLSYRTKVWRHLDAKRTGFVGLQDLAKSLSRSVCIEHYLNFALSCPIVFVENLGYLVPTKAITFREWMKNGILGLFPSLEDFQVHLSLLFPEVRPRGYMELRSIDCQSRVWQTAPAAFYVGLLYDEANLNRVLELLLPTLDQTEELMLLAEGGLMKSEILKSKLPTLMAWAIEGVGRVPKGFCADDNETVLKAFFHRFTERGRTPAQDLVDFVRARGRKYPELEDFSDLEHEWQTIIAS